ncbi:MAG: DUF2975 domain-containing protein [Clostridium sp.]
MNKNFEKYELMIKISMVLIILMSIFVGFRILNLEPNLEYVNRNNGDIKFEKIVLDSKVFSKAYIILTIVTLLFESILYKMLKLVKEINKKEIIGQKSSTILKSMSRTVMLYIIVTLFTGQINKISAINNEYLIDGSGTLNKMISSWVFNTGFDAITIGVMIILVIILLQILIEGVKIKEENDLTV